MVTCIQHHTRLDVVDERPRHRGRRVQFFSGQWCSIAEAPAVGPGELQLGNDVEVGGPLVEEHEPFHTFAPCANHPWMMSFAEPADVDVVEDSYTLEVRGCCSDERPAHFEIHFNPTQGTAWDIKRGAQCCWRPGLHLDG